MFEHIRSISSLRLAVYLSIWAIPIALCQSSQADFDLPGAHQRPEYRGDLGDRASASLEFADSHALIYGGTHDSPANLSTTDPRFGGVGMISWTRTTGGGTETVFGSGVLIAPNKVLTAAHLFDPDLNGSLNATGPITFRTSLGNVTVDPGAGLGSVTMAPGYTGWNIFSGQPGHEDLAILTLPTAIAGAPIYSIYAGNPLGREITMVGYGYAGNGTDGADMLLHGPDGQQRAGRNVVDLLLSDDDLSGDGHTGANEMYVFDFDGLPPHEGPLGSGSLGNDIESQLASGDSGGAAFVQLADGSFALLGINTFIGSFNLAGFNLIDPGKFGSGGGGVLLSSYRSWIVSHQVPAPGAALLVLVGLAATRWMRRKVCL